MNNNKKKYMEMVVEDYHNIEFVPEELLDDEDFIFGCMEQNPTSLIFCGASNRLKDIEENIIKTILLCEYEDKDTLSQNDSLASWVGASDRLCEVCKGFYSVETTIALLNGSLRRV